MEDEEFKGLDDYLAILKRRKWQLIVPAVLIFIASAAVAYLLPAVYRSEATILIEQQQIPTDLVRSTITSYAGERIQVISQRVMTSDNLAKIIEDFGLYKKIRSNTGMSILVDKLRNNINLEMVSAQTSGRNSKGVIAFKLSFTDENPRLTQKVTNELVSLYLNENLKRRTQTALETSGFLAAEAERLRGDVDKLEGQLAVFKQKNINNLPQHQQLTLQLMQRSEGELAQVKQQIQVLEDRRIYLRTELSQMSPTSDLSALSEDELTSLQKEYARLSVQYTENHPTMIMLKEKIEALKESEPSVEDQNLDGQITSESTSQKVMADNPAYLQLQHELKTADIELAALKLSGQKIVKKIEEFEKRLMQSPQVEREYRSLTRDYDNSLAKFKEIKGKQLEADLAESLERESMGERFSLIEPPRVPGKPTKPNRMAILFLGFVFSFAGGIGHVVLRESMDQTIYGSKEMMAITKVPALAVIPYIQNSQDKNRGVTWRIVVILFVIIMIISSVAAIHFFYKPLDVLWYVILRKLGVEIGI